MEILPNLLCVTVVAVLSPMVARGTGYSGSGLRFEDGGGHEVVGFLLFAL
jgi:hypothetical protein